MICRVSDLKYKDVINVKDGTRLGFVSDVEIDTADARLLALVIYGKCKFFGLLGREDDLIISWCDICVIGEDIILVEIRDPDHAKRVKRPSPFAIFTKS